MVQVDAPKENSGEPPEPATQPATPSQVAIGSRIVDSDQITRDAYSATDLDAPDSLNIAAASDGGFQGSGSVAEETFDDAPGAVAPDAWQSDRTKQKRQVALIAAVSAATFLMAVFVFVWFVRSRGTQQAGLTETPPALENDRQSSALELNENEPQQPRSEAEADPEAEPLNNDNDTDTDTDTSEQSEQSETSEPNDVEPSSERIGSGAIPIDMMPIDPLAEPDPSVEPAREPSSPPGSGDASPAAPPDDENPSPELREIPKGLAPFLDLLDLDGEANEVTPTIETPPGLDRADLEEAAEETLDPMMIATPPPTINAKRVLSVEFAIDSQGYPLGDFVLLISQITGVPIQLDWVSLDIMQIDVADPIIPSRGTLSAKQHLEKLCESFGGKMSIEESLIVLTIDDKLFADRFKAVTTLDDFGDDAGEVISLLNQFMSTAENDSDDQLDQLKTPATRTEQQLLMLAVDTMRRLRGIGPKIEEKSFSRWAYFVTSPKADWPVLSDGDLGPPLYAPVTIAGLLRRVSRQNKATCVVNWFDANRRRLSPEQLMMPYAKDNAGEVFRRLLDPFEVQVRVVDEKHWWVGTDASYDRLSTLVWTEPLGEGRDKRLARIKATMAGATADTFRILYDPKSDRAMMMLPRFVVRQMPKILL
ncbi:hypothetical protein Q31b_16220 [Novipirellula aureliae]|uniref:Transmembrane protein n=2 Tax=Novipirellula aureliae TaxID=2527966 RepID=A0A5C6E7Y3_9BACT|nr:hypothetical protein Q31b_16220 [Novipirellula aureliae]